jgi:hypothetical protein
MELDLGRVQAAKQLLEQAMQADAHHVPTYMVCEVLCSPYRFSITCIFLPPDKPPLLLSLGIHLPLPLDSPCHITPW